MAEEGLREERVGRSCELEEVNGVLALEDIAAEILYPVQ